MSTTEQPLTEAIASSLPLAAREGADLLGVSMEDGPKSIVEAIQEFVAKPKKKSWFKRIDYWHEQALPLGALWGTQLVRAFDWEWATVIQHDHDDCTVTGVFNPNRSFAIYPFHYVLGCCKNGVYPTILLAYNMMEAGTLPTFEDRAYMNVMDGVRHIVPPD